MTEATEHVQPNPQDPQQPPVAVVASTDPDEIELQQALALAKAEETGAPPAGQAQPNGGTQAQQTAAPGPKDQTAPGAQPEGVMIPKARFDEVLARATKAEQEAAYQRGLAEGRQPAAPAPGQPGGQPQPAAATPEQRLAAIDTEIDALATKFDNGEITMADYKKQERALDDKRLAIRDEGLVARVKPVEAPVADNALYLDNLTAQLEDAHPWVNVLQQVGTDHDWAYLKALATDNLIARKIDPTQNTTIVSYELRKEMAQLADTMGPGLLTARAQAKGIALPGQTQQDPQQPAGGKPAPTPNAANRAAKLALAATAPPNLSAMTGTPGAPGVDVSDTTVEAMTDEAIGALPAAARNRLLGITSG